MPGVFFEEVAPSFFATSHQRRYSSTGTPPSDLEFFTMDFAQKLALSQHSAFIKDSSQEIIGNHDLAFNDPPSIFRSPFLVPSVGGGSGDSRSSCSTDGGADYAALNEPTAFELMQMAAQSRKSQNTTECVPVPSSEHVAEIVGRQGCKIKALRAKTNTYIKTPVRGEDSIFVVTGRKEDVEAAKLEILSAAEHFTQIRASRRHSQGGAPAPGHVTAYVRVPYKFVGLVVGPKGATIKRVQQQTHTYIVTPSRDKEPVFEVTGLADNVESARREIEAHIGSRTGCSAAMLAPSLGGGNHVGNGVPTAPATTTVYYVRNGEDASLTTLAPSFENGYNAAATDVHFGRSGDESVAVAPSFGNVAKDPLGLQGQPGFAMRAPSFDSVSAAFYGGQNSVMMLLDDFQSNGVDVPNFSPPIML